MWSVSYFCPSRERPAKSYIDARVVLEAKRILAHTTLSVAATGEDLGFSEPTNFVKFFKVREGCLPGVVRERGAGRLTTGSERSLGGVPRPRGSRGSRRGRSG
jgi:AraC-like DNA-binding protein